jgi:hypothetical protein
MKHVDRMMRHRLLVLAALAACSPPPVYPPPPPPSDAGTHPQNDAGSTTDAGTTVDAGTPFDAGTTVDAGEPTDAGEPVDGGEPFDAGQPIDAGQPVDAGQPIDAGHPTVDGGLTYVDDIHPLWVQAGCTSFNCHGSIFGAGVLVMLPDPRTGWLDMINRPSIRDAGIIVIPGDPVNSVLAIHGRTTLMSNAIINAAQEQEVERWISQGARYSQTDATAPTTGLFSSVLTDGGTSCLFDGVGSPALPAVCMPRCSAATTAAVETCLMTPADGGTCIDTALTADMTPSLTMGFGGQGDVIALDCSLCVNLQDRSCADQFCRFELIAFDRCASVNNGSVAPCGAETAALRACFAANPGFDTCDLGAIARCGP